MYNLNIKYDIVKRKQFYTVTKSQRYHNYVVMFAIAISENKVTLISSKRTESNKVIVYLMNFQ